MNRQQQIGGPERAVCRPADRGHTVTAQLRQQSAARVVVAEILFRAEKHVRPDVVPIDDPAPHAERMEDQSKMVRLIRDQRGVRQRRHHLRRRVVSHQAIGVAIEHDGGVWLMPVEQELQHTADVRHFVGRQRRVPVDLRVAGASSSRLRCRSGTSSASAIVRSACRLGWVLPVSMKLT
jgi:hypothetical protein